MLVTRYFVNRERSIFWIPSVGVIQQSLRARPWLLAVGRPDLSSLRREHPLIRGAFRVVAGVGRLARSDPAGRYIQFQRGFYRRTRNNSPEKYDESLKFSPFEGVRGRERKGATFPFPGSLRRGRVSAG